MRSEIGQPLTFTNSDGTTTSVKVTEDIVGTRKPVASTILETVTFNDNGTAAYSNQDVDGDGDTAESILVDGVICAKYFYYNTDRVNSKTIDKTSIVVEPKSFYWNVGAIPQSELVLTYDVYLNGSMEGTRSPGAYKTNNYANLNYTNYLGNACLLSADSPVLPWSQANVGYGFYLVNREGKSIINQTTGAIGSFDQSIRITQPVYIDFKVGADPVKIVAAESGTALPEGYELFDAGAAYSVSVSSGGTGQYVITMGDGVTTQTTYVVGVSSSAVTGGATGDGETTQTTNYATANTIVWFAVVADVQCIPDTVVVDYGLPVDIDVVSNDSLMGNNSELRYVGSFDIFAEGYAEARQEKPNLTKWEYLQFLGLSVSTTPSFETDTLHQWSCYIQFSTMKVFTSDVTGCKQEGCTIIDSGVFNGLCYHVPTNNKNIFMS